MSMNYPLDLRFKLLAISSQIAVRDATGRMLLYVKQRAFKLREAVTVFADDTQSTPLYRIAADRILDISAQYHIDDRNGVRLGMVQRRGMKSLWRAHYEIGRGGTTLFEIQEENPWIKVLDGVLGEIPVVGIFTGYWLHPAYSVTTPGAGTKVLRVVKKPALWEGRYQIERFDTIPPDVEELALLGILMMVLLERARG